jgi:hypothetical protein
MRSGQSAFHRPDDRLQHESFDLLEPISQRLLGLSRIATGCRPAQKWSPRSRGKSSLPWRLSPQRQQDSLRKHRDVIQSNAKEPGDRVADGGRYEGSTHLPHS